MCKKFSSRLDATRGSLAHRWIGKGDPFSHKFGGRINFCLKCDVLVKKCHFVYKNRQEFVIFPKTAIVIYFAKNAFFIQKGGIFRSKICGGGGSGLQVRGFIYDPLFTYAPAPCTERHSKLEIPYFR